LVTGKKGILGKFKTGFVVRHLFKRQKRDQGTTYRDSEKKKSPQTQGLTRVKSGWERQKSFKEEPGGKSNTAAKNGKRTTTQNVRGGGPSYLKTREKRGRLVINRQDGKKEKPPPQND